MSLTKLLSLKKVAFKKVTSRKDLQSKNRLTKEFLLSMKTKVNVIGSLYSTTLMKTFNKKAK